MYDWFFHFFSHAFEIFSTECHNARKTGNLIARRSLQKIEGTYWKASIYRQAPTTRKCVKEDALSKRVSIIPRCVEKYRSPSMELKKIVFVNEGKFSHFFISFFNYFWPSATGKHTIFENLKNLVNSRGNLNRRVTILRELRKIIKLR